MWCKSCRLGGNAFVVLQSNGWGSMGGKFLERGVLVGGGLDCQGSRVEERAPVGRELLIENAAFFAVVVEYMMT